MKRIAIIGASCSGKSTFGKELSRKLNLMFTDLDDLFWNPGWQQSETDFFFNKVKDILAINEWVIVGNYQSVQESILKNADTVIWLDYSAFVVWKRALIRTIKRAIFKEPCCNGNFESLKLSFLSRDSILLWVYKDYPRKKKRYEQLLASGQFENKHFYRFRSPIEAENFFKHI